ncbi:hypothetical protein FQ775_23295 [Nitratireductor mangrovi]|uniref:DUF4148 domain-containing protein n=1 Tax=Nitratireductor mangrovi TaxID=2599600 RepID=A0A5B8L573_9HYPH|nr:hypothetical protein [Nitratireductor mangrovi]QDZ03054.1 hypothetical protein FQ775_23295 [Nitratireductor mangrovi]
MLSRRSFIAGALGAALLAGSAPGAQADTYLGSYVARISGNDHYASDGYPLDNAAQVVRQDRANFHRFGTGDAEDDYDPWFGSNKARARLQSMLEKRGAMSGGTRRAIMNGNPLIEVQVFSRSVKVRVLR